MEEKSEDLAGKNITPETEISLLHQFDPLRNAGFKNNNFRFK